MKLKISRKKVFILGAGFSKAVANFPLQNELSKKLSERKSFSSNAEVRACWKKYVLDNNIGNIKNPDESNFEEIMTYLSEQYVYEDFIVSQMKSVLFDKIALTLKKILQEYKDMPSYRDNISKEYLKHFANYLQRNSVKVFSFNYDTVLEDILLAQNNLTEDNLDLVYKPSEFFDRQRHFMDDSYQTIQKVKLFKLHGSVNWVRYSKNSSIQVSDICATGKEVVLIPPTTRKETFYNEDLFIAIWKNFARALKTANEVYIIGYSIPETDRATYYALKTLLKKDTKVYVINKSTSKKEEERLESIFGKNLDKAFLKLGFDESFVNKLIGIE